MRRTLVFAKHELMDYFASPLGIVSIVAFLFLSGMSTVGLGGWLDRGRADLVPFFYAIVWMLPFIVPALTVRLWTDERAADTIEMIENLPLTTAQSVVGKWLAAWLVITLSILCALPIWIVVNVLGSADNGVIFLSVFMAILMCGGLASASLLFAAIGRDFRRGMGAAIGGLLVLNVIGWPTFVDALPSSFSSFLSYFSPYSHFEGAVQGVLKVSDIFYFVTGTGLCLLATMVVISIRMPPKKAMRQERQQSVEGKRIQRARALKYAVIIVLALNIVVARTSDGVRWDVTEEGLHTLTPGTVQVLSQIKNPITIRLYYSDALSDSMPGAQDYYFDVRRKLENFNALSHGQIRTEFYNPTPGSESVIHAGAFGLRPVIGAEEVTGAIKAAGNDAPAPIKYFGLVASNSNDNLEVLPVLDPSRRRFIEHDLTRIVDALNDPRRKVVGLMSTLQVDPDTLTQAEQVGSRTWAVIDLIRKLFTLRKVPLDVEEISPDLDVLMIVHPRNLSTKTLYAIDQFAMRGGRLLVFVDPNAEVVRSLPGGATKATSSDFNKLLETWGVILDPYMVLGDIEAARPVKGIGAGRDQIIDYLAWPSFTKGGFSTNSPVMGDLERINMGSPGVFIAAQGHRTLVEPLIMSGPKSMRFGSRMVDANPNPKALLEQFVSEGKRFTVAARITGSVNSAFKDGLAGVDPSHHLNASIGSVNIFVVADVDMLFDTFWFFPDPSVQPRFAEPLKRGGRSVVVMADNSRFVIRALTHLSANVGVVTLEEAVEKPRVFDVVMAIKDKYAPHPRGKERRLHDEIKAVAESIDDLSGRRMASGGPGLSREESALLVQLPRKAKSLNAELVNLPEVIEREAKISSEMGRLFNWVRFWTILFMPLILAAGTFLLVRRYRNLS